MQITYRPFAITASVALACLCSFAGAEPIRVPGDYATVGEALDAAQPTMEIQVAQGLYLEHDLVVPIGVRLVGLGDSPADVVIDAQGLGRVVTLAPGSEGIENLTLRNGDADLGGGLSVEQCYATLRHLRIVDCAADLGGGLFVREGPLLLEDSEITDCHARGLGGGLYLIALDAATLTRCLVARNDAVSAGGGWYAARCDAVTLESCTIAFNAAPLGAESALFHSAVAEYDHTVVAGCRPLGSDSEELRGDRVLLADRTDAVTADCSLRHAPGWIGSLAPLLESPAAQNVEADPLFCLSGSAPEGVYGVASSSPCVTGDCGLIGAYGQACGETAAPETPIARFQLSPAYPNPFNPSTRIDFAIGTDAPVSLKVYSLDGRCVATLVDEARPAGAYSATWTGRDHGGRTVASGVYVARLVAGRRSAAIRLTLIK